MNMINDECLIGKGMNIRNYIDEFLEIYQERPIKDNIGGMLSTHLFWAWYMVKKIRPKNIIESGVFKGQGTWIFRKADSNINIFSIDPVLNRRVYIDDRATYFTQDFSLIFWEKYLDPQDTLCFFDDHQDAYMRLMQMKWMGFLHAMFEDNYPVRQGDCYSLNKIFSGKGFVNDEKKVIIPENTTHMDYVNKNIDFYTTLPPLFKNEKTRWGDDWNEKDYPTPAPILGEEESNVYPILKKEAYGYTWICYVKLK